MTSRVLTKRNYCTRHSTETTAVTSPASRKALSCAGRALMTTSFSRMLEVASALPAVSSSCFWSVCSIHLKMMWSRPSWIAPLRDRRSPAHPPCALTSGNVGREHSYCSWPAGLKTLLQTSCFCIWRVEQATQGSSNLKPGRFVLQQLTQLQSELPPIAD